MKDRFIFYYGVMGSAKTAQALIHRFKLLENGDGVLLLKPATDTRDGCAIIKSRIGLQASANLLGPHDSIIDTVEFAPESYDAIIVDEAQFLTPDQVYQLRQLVDASMCQVFCYGLMTDFRTHLFPGSARLVELADELRQIPSYCKCGRLATVNARLDEGGKIVKEGDQIKIGGNESYIAMCHDCWEQERVFSKITPSA